MWVSLRGFDEVKFHKIEFEIVAAKTLVSRSKYVNTLPPNITREMEIANKLMMRVIDIATVQKMSHY